jgi:hypothetical protein
MPRVNHEGPAVALESVGRFSQQDTNRCDEGRRSIEADTLQFNYLATPKASRGDQMF